MVPDRRRTIKESALLALSFIVLGAMVGALTVVLSIAVDSASVLFAENPYLIWLMPIAGFIAYGIYRALKLDFSWSTGRVMEAAQDEQPIPPLLAPAIILSTTLTVLCGGSVGKEAAALQMGAGMSTLLRSRVPERFRRSLAPAAMAAALGAMLNAPLAGVVFSFEALRKHPRSIAALAAPMITSFAAWGVVELAGVRFLEASALSSGASSINGLYALGGMDPVYALILIVIATGVAAGSLALIFCSVLKWMRIGLARLGAPVFALAVGGVATALIVGYTGLFHFDEMLVYCGTGSLQIEMALTGEAMLWWAFAAKMILTLLTFAGGFKGGEIMPVLAIGACLGATAGSLSSTLLGVDANIILVIAAMAAFFAACTNCPLTALVLVLELFGVGVIPFAVLATAPAFLIAIPVSLYPTSAMGRQ